jgi:hypothetical protein
MAERRSNGCYSKRRRTKSSTGAATDDDSASIEMSSLVGQVDELMKERARLFSLIANEFLYDMMKPSEKERLVADLWAGSLEPSLGMLRGANPELVALLCAKMPNTSPSTEHARAAEEQHLGALCYIVRDVQGARRRSWIFQCRTSQDASDDLRLMRRRRSLGALSSRVDSGALTIPWSTPERSLRPPRGPRWGTTVAVPSTRCSLGLRSRERRSSASQRVSVARARRPCMRAVACRVHALLVLGVLL